MSEKLKSNGEKDLGSSSSNHLDVLTEMSDKFDPEKASELAERDAEKKEKVNYLAVMPEKREKELTPKDAANEYLSLLDELSKDFTNRFYQDDYDGKAEHHAGSICRGLAKDYSDNPNYNRDISGSDYLVYDKTMARMGSAEAILEAELGWRQGGEKIAQANEEIDQKIADLDGDYSKKGRLGKFFGRNKYNKAKKELEDLKQQMEYRFTTKSYGTGRKKFNNIIAEELAISYDEQGKNWHDQKDIDKRNEELNRRFFGLDDPERAAKVERALELRSKYEAEWIKK